MIAKFSENEMWNEETDVVVKAACGRSDNRCEELSMSPGRSKRSQGMSVYDMKTVNRD